MTNARDVIAAARTLAGIAVVAAMTLAAIAAAIHDWIAGRAT